MPLENALGSDNSRLYLSEWRLTLYCGFLKFSRCSNVSVSGALVFVQKVTSSMPQEVDFLVNFKFYHRDNCFLFLLIFKMKLMEGTPGTDFMCRFC